MLSPKEEKYIELIREIKDCRICQHIKAPAYCEDGECLVNDSHGLVPGQEAEPDKVYVNRWNMWQGSLEAEIMVIGLDFGRIERGSIDEPQQHWWWEEGKRSGKDKAPEWKSPTDKNLHRIFKKVFGEEFLLTKKCDKLYFTNTACCYRQKSSSGPANSAWYAFCAGKYLGKLIRIIEPKLIIALGLQAFEALGCCERGRLICTDEVKPEGELTLEKLLGRPYHFELALGGRRIKAAPVFHPGANIRRNRTRQEEDEDWERIHRIYEQVRGEGGCDGGR